MVRMEQSDLAQRAGVSVDTIKRLERTIGPISANVATMNSVVSVLEATGIEFTNGGQPGVRMSSDLINLRSRNARLRSRIEQLLERSDQSIQEAVRRVALEQSLVVSDDTAESLQDVHDNLRRRADTLIHAGVAKPEDFEGMIWPPA